MLTENKSNTTCVATSFACRSSFGTYTGTVALTILRIIFGLSAGALYFARNKMMEENENRESLRIPVIIKCILESTHYLQIHLPSR